MKILSWLEAWTAVVVLLLVLHVLFYFSLLDGNNGQFDPHYTTLSDWKKAESLDNPYLAVSEFHAGKPVDFVSRQKNISSVTLIPLFETKEEAENPSHISSIAITDHLLSNAEVKQLRKSNSIQGIVLSGNARTDYVDAINRHYVGVTIAADFIQLGDRPSVEAYYLACAFLLLGVPFSWYFIIRKFGSFGVPSGDRQSHLMIAVGTICFAGLAYLRLQYRFCPVGPEQALAFGFIDWLLNFSFTVAASGGLFLLIKERMYKRKIFGKRKVVFMGDSVEVLTYRKRQAFTFNDITSVSYAYDVDREYTTGKPPKYSFNLVASAEKARAQGVLEYDEGQKLQMHVNRLIQHLANRYLQGIQDGSRVAFKDWEISGDELTLIKKKKRTVVRLQDINRIEFCQNKYCIWDDESDSHRFEYGAETTNADVLKIILSHFANLKSSTVLTFDKTNRGADLLSQQPLAQKLNSGPGERSILGRIMFEHSFFHKWVVIAYHVTVIPVVILLFQHQWWYASVAFAIGAPITLLTFFFAGGHLNTFRQHERGVSLQRSTNKAEILFEDLEAITYEHTVIYSYGIHISDQVKITIKGSTLDSKAEVIKLKWEQWMSEQEKLRATISKAIAISMAERLTQQSSVAWTSQVTILRDGIEGPVKSGVLSYTEKVTFDRISHVQFRKNKLHIEIDGNQKTSIIIDCKKENFFPGHCLFSQMLEIAMGKDQRELVESLAAY